MGKVYKDSEEKYISHFMLYRGVGSNSHLLFTDKERTKIAYYELIKKQLSSFIPIYIEDVDPDYSDHRITTPVCIYHTYIDTFVKEDTVYGINEMMAELTMIFKMLGLIKDEEAVALSSGQNVSLELNDMCPGLHLQGLYSISISSPSQGQTYYKSSYMDVMIEEFEYFYSQHPTKKLNDFLEYVKQTSDTTCGGASTLIFLATIKVVSKLKTMNEDELFNMLVDMFKMMREQ